MLERYTASWHAVPPHGLLMAMMLIMWTLECMDRLPCLWWKLTVMKLCRVSESVVLFNTTCFSISVPPLLIAAHSVKWWGLNFEIMIDFTCTSALKKVSTDGGLSSSVWSNQQYIPLSSKCQLQQYFHPNLSYGHTYSNTLLMFRGYVKLTVSVVSTYTWPNMSTWATGLIGSLKRMSQQEN